MQRDRADTGVIYMGDVHTVTHAGIIHTIPEGMGGGEREREQRKLSLDFSRFCKHRKKHQIPGHRQDVDGFEFSNAWPIEP